MNHYSKTKEIRVEIKHLAINTLREVVLYDERDAKTLREAILHYKVHLEEQDIEIFEHYKNILWTDSGIYIALFDSGLNEPKEVKPTAPVSPVGEPVTVLK